MIQIGSCKLRSGLNACNFKEIWFKERCVRVGLGVGVPYVLYFCESNTIVHFAVKQLSFSWIKPNFFFSLIFYSKCKLINFFLSLFKLKAISCCFIFLLLFPCRKIKREKKGTTINHINGLYAGRSVNFFFHRIHKLIKNFEFKSTFYFIKKFFYFVISLYFFFFHIPTTILKEGYANELSTWFVWPQRIETTIYNEYWILYEYCYVHHIIMSCIFYCVISKIHKRRWFPSLLLFFFRLWRLHIAIE